MKRKINIQFISISILAVVATLLLCASAFYDLFEKQVIDDLKTYTELIRGLNISSQEEFMERLDMLEKDNLRVTLVNHEGIVTYDSAVDSTVMENHGDRPEVMEAFENGSGSSRRKSATMDKNRYYYAIKLDDTQILRVSREAGSIWSIFESVIPLVCIASVLIIAVCAVLARILTKSLIKPIEQLADHMENVSTINTYPELMPFITTIHNQHQDIIKSSKMRQEFTANVTHELKTPLTSISGYSELIENGMASGENVHHFAKEIHKNASRLLTLINDILRLSQLDSQEMSFPNTNIDLYAAAETCVEMLQLSAKKHQVQISLEGQHCIVKANRQMMDELIYNLIDNAIRYNNPDGTVAVLIKDEGKRVILSVRDTGIGISKEHQERIFERFYRVDKSRSKFTGGTGLGLAIVKHIVAQYDASLELESEEGKGTEIKVVFYKE